ncbi:alpha/beta hydrolase [Haloplasma contractile]|uniref:Lysophospholipase Lipid metabolism protein n=1 Tax=Haloplasma contractile SSD-17B TaxID=1033810 RepID=U2E7K0_9MOLU|nr:alpha/beta hydrolase [Haloplasma contractile]ERJ11178.1 Lysophospholipase Lipid metabolism protein [Haloplasma contractile SSD-17B]
MKENRTISGYNGSKINFNFYECEHPKGSVIIVHGMCEHKNRYNHYADFLRKYGYHVYTYDHRGHGDSICDNVELGDIGRHGFNSMVYDLKIMNDYVKQKEPQLPIFIYGHSMGSFITQRYMQLHGNLIDGIILSGSNGKTPTPILVLGKIISRLLFIFKGRKSKGKFLNKLSFGSFNKRYNDCKTDFDWLSRDDSEVKKYIDDEKCGYVCSNEYYYELYKGMHERQKSKHIKQVPKDLPILIISGDMDPVGNYGKGVQNLYGLYQNQVDHLTIKLYNDARHELLNEINKQEVMSDTLLWLNTQASPNK